MRKRLSVSQDERSHKKLERNKYDALRSSPSNTIAGREPGARSQEIRTASKSWQKQVNFPLESPEEQQAC